MSLSRMTKKQSKGFLLLEVLVSVTLISVSLIYVVRSLSASTRAVQTGTNFLKSIAFLEEELWNLEAKGCIGRGSHKGGDASGEDYGWMAKATPLKDAPLNHVNLKVEWQRRDRKQRISIDTFLWNEE